ncbi:hypothetical protein, partial [Orbus sasakiae]|uniref:hypothetical protein n=1 Tax=Orbus sasakiae TaxID=1078475 RepID=UPI0031EDA052
ELTAFRFAVSRVAYTTLSFFVRQDYFYLFFNFVSTFFIMLPNLITGSIFLLAVSQWKRIIEILLV